METQEKDIERELRTYPARIARKRATAKRRLEEHDKLMAEADRMQADYENLKKQNQQ